MKINQFGRIKTDLKTELKELTDIRFISSNPVENAKKQFKDFLRMATLEAHSDTIFNQKMGNLLATPNSTVADFLENDEPITDSVFYLIALQLLQFQVDIDFDPEKPVQSFKKMKLPVVVQSELETGEDVAHAWYVLLTTHTKNGETYLDQLAQQGYFVPFYKDTTKPLIFNGKTQPVFDPHQTIREVVYVEAPLDTDEDGKRDLIKAEILRPAQTKDGYNAPVLYTSSPYNQGINDEMGEKATHNADVPLVEKEPNNLTKEAVTAEPFAPVLPAERPVKNYVKEAEQSFAKEQSYTLNNYFLARGFAIVYSAGIGTRDSEGIRDTGSVEETVSTVAIIEWLAGNRTAFTNKTDNIAIDAWWSNKKIAMTGRSYLGTLATAAATTGVKGLETIVSEAAISSWYDYYRDGGLVAAPDTFQGEDMDVLAMEVFSRMQDAGDYLGIKDYFNKVMERLGRDQDRTTGNYSKFWDSRNYLNNAKNIKADMIMVHGLNDWNVKPRNVGNLWNAIRDLPINKKVVLHQGQHIYINAFRSIDFTDMLNLWFSYKLLDVQNDADKVLPNVIIQDNVEAETWNTYPDWQDTSDTDKTFTLQPKFLIESNLETKPAAASFKDYLDDDIFDNYKSNLSQWHTDLFNTEHATNGKNNMRNNRLIFKSVQLDEDWFIDGVPEVKVSVAANQPFGMLSFQLVDYGSAKRLTTTPTILNAKSLSGSYDWRTDDLREFTLQKQSTPWKMISKGHINLQNRTNNYKVDEVKPNEFYDVSVKLQPTFYHLVKGHQLGLVIYATDFETTIRGNQRLQYSLQLNDSELTVHLNNHHKG
ncbi:Xaa-Pro dipeptidyl-peptidase [Pediococcus argentinicus]|uniref:Xaa-Pro dipeptidyl-peptidase n=1 Tax=Pediococcus argentinicus TaxID=480391 RepID=A0A0R2NM21_9LACO|nr:Xaa-Pro dipeptidyl-peptidase [Pediococcus argentinicus]KRO25874.1 pepX protein [Pediococcus argentinicus]NKZ21867.1 Xaa-Pro dipeptidyl-peptidase [Pediococcus argentinicus]GEP19037.1 Xaa-Pro dipeptidyl-peptidase [Pediococcus argentinicus]